MNKSGLKYFLAVICISLVSTFAFFQMSSLNTLRDYWVAEKFLTNEQIGILSSCYLYSDAITLLFAGVIIDNFKLKYIISTSFIVILFGFIIPLISLNFYWMILIKIITGSAHAFALIGVFRMGTYLFDEKKHGLIFGIILSIAICGALLSQGAYNFYIVSTSWRTSSLGLFILGLCLLPVVWLVLHKLYIYNNPNHFSFRSFLSEYKKVILIPTNYLAAINISLLSLPVVVMGMIFGNQFLMVHHISTIDAANISGMMFIGQLIGFPCIGKIADFFFEKKITVLLIFSILSLVLFFAAFYINFNVYGYLIMFFLIGFVTSCQTIGYTLIAEANPKEINSAGMAFSNWLLMFLTASIIIVISLNQTYSILIILLCLLIACFMSLALKSYCITDAIRKRY